MAAAPPLPTPPSLISTTPSFQTEQSGVRNLPDLTAGKMMYIYNGVVSPDFNVKGLVFSGFKRVLNKL